MSIVNIKVKPSLIVALLFFAFFNKLQLFICFYFCALIHEFAHFIMCIMLGEKAELIELKSYGVCLKTGFVKNPVSSFFISIAGPVMSIVLYFLSSNKSQNFAFGNLIIFCVNILPALPLDGGSILKSVLSLYFGYVKSHCIMITITKIIACFFIIFGIFLIIMTKYNISLLIIGFFLLYNTIYEKNNLISLKKKLICNEFSNGNMQSVKHFAMHYDTPAIKCIDCFTYNTVIVVNVLDSHNKLVGTLWQYDLTDAFLNSGSSLKLGQLIKMKGYKNELTKKT